MNYEPPLPQEKLIFFLIHVGVTKLVGIPTVMMMPTSPTTDLKTSYFTVTVASTVSPAATAHRDKTITTSAATVTHSEQGTERPQNLTMIIEQVLTRTDPAYI